MTVIELIEKLKAMPPDAIIALAIPNAYALFSHIGSLAPSVDKSNVIILPYKPKATDSNREAGLVTAQDLFGLKDITDN